MNPSNPLTSPHLNPPCLPVAARRHRAPRVGLARLRRPLCPLAVTVLLCLGGCTVARPWLVEEERARLPSLERGLPVKPLPMAIALHVPRTVAEGAETERRNVSQLTVQASTLVPYVVWAARQMFDRVDEVDAPGDPERLPPGVDGVLRVDALSSNRIRVTLLATGSAPVEWTAWGGDAKAGLGSDEHKRATSRRLRDLLANFIVNFREQPGLREWIERVRPGARVEPRFGQEAVGDVPRQVAVMSGDDGDAKECLGGRTEPASGAIRFADVEAIRTAMYPWLERSTAPASPDDWAAWPASPLVRHELARRGVAYLVNYSERGGMFDKSGGVACGYMGCLGLETGTTTSGVHAHILETFTGQVTRLDRERKAGYAIPALGIALPLIPPTRAGACADLAGDFAQLLRGATR